MINRRSNRERRYFFSYDVSFIDALTHQYPKASPEGEA